jgi:hypothetical protein
MDRLPYFPEVVKVKVQVVDGVEHGRRDFLPFIEVAEVSAAEIPAGVASALRVDRAFVPRIF